MVSLFYQPQQRGKEHEALRLASLPQPFLEWGIRSKKPSICIHSCHVTRGKVNASTSCLFWIHVSLTFRTVRKYTIKFIKKKLNSQFLEVSLCTCISFQGIVNTTEFTMWACRNILKNKNFVFSTFFLTSMNMCRIKFRVELSLSSVLCCKCRSILSMTISTKSF